MTRPIQIWNIPYSSIFGSIWKIWNVPVFRSILLVQCLIWLKSGWVFHVLQTLELIALRNTLKRELSEGSAEHYRTPNWSRWRPILLSTCLKRQFQFHRKTPSILESTALHGASYQRSSQFWVHFQALLVKSYRREWVLEVLKLPLEVSVELTPVLSYTRTLPMHNQVEISRRYRLKITWKNKWKFVLRYRVVVSRLDADRCDTLKRREKQLLDSRLWRMILLISKGTESGQRKNYQGKRTDL